MEDWTEEQWEEYLQARKPEIIIGGWDTPPLPEHPPPGLKYVCNLTGGVRHFLPRSYLENGIQVTNWGNAISHTIAEMALYLMLHGLRYGPATHELMHHGHGWKQDLPAARSLFNRKVGIHGFGRIARELVKLLQPFGVTISAYSPPVPDDDFRAFAVTRANSLESLFSGCEILVELEGLTPETRGMVQERHFSLLPDGALFVNVGRAGVVEESALVREAVSGRLHFGLDVFWEEPLPADHPLRGLPNVALFPHIAGATEDQIFRLAERARENIGRYLQGGQLLEPLTPEAYDQIT